MDSSIQVVQITKSSSKDTVNTPLSKWGQWSRCHEQHPPGKGDPNLIIVGVIFFYSSELSRQALISALALSILWLQLAKCDTGTMFTFLKYGKLANQMLEDLVSIVSKDISSILKMASI